MCVTRWISDTDFYRKQLRVVEGDGQNSVISPTSTGHVCIHSQHWSVFIPELCRLSAAWQF